MEGTMALVNGERLAQSPALWRDVWPENVNERLNNTTQRGIIKWKCGCYANTGIHRWILTLPS